MSMAITPAPKGRHFPLFPRRLFIEQALFALLCWGGFSLVMLIIPIGVSLFRPIEVSGWGLVQQVINWFVLIIGIHLGWQALEQHVTHGQSRKSFLQSAGIFVLAWPALVAALSAITYVPEALVYNLAGWPQVMAESQLYDNVLDMPLVFIQLWLTLSLWTAGGLALGLAWYRDTLTGSLVIPLCVLLGGLANLSMSRADGPLGFLVREGYLPQEPQLGLAIVVHLACTVALLAVSWYLGRDVAIRKKAV